jgi:hypothetical protein
MAFSDQTTQVPPSIGDKSLLDAPAGRISWRWWGLWLIGFGAFSMMMPRDASYDVVHYHLYNGWAALNDRSGQDLAPAEMHSFLNPVWQVFIWLLVDNLPGRLVAFLLGIMQALTLPALYALTRRLLTKANIKPALVTVLAIALAGFTAESQFVLMATVRNDAVFAGLFIAALVLLVPDSRKTPSLAAFALASFLVGALIGVKVTNAIYGVFFSIAALMIMPSWTARLKIGSICAIAGLTGILIFGGAWAWQLYSAYGNPIFPNVNGFFNAPLGPDTPFRDTRYLPDELFEAIIRPFFFLFDGSLVNDYDFFDPRLQIGYVSSLAIIGLSLNNKPKSSPAYRPALAFAVATLVTIIIWSLVFSIARYIAALWMLGPLMLVIVVTLTKPKWLSHKSTPLITLILAALLFAATNPTQLRRVAWTSWTQPYYSADVPHQTDYENTIIAFSGDYPGAFLAPSLPTSAQFTHMVPPDWSAPALENYREQIRSLIQAETKPLFVVIVDVEDHFDQTVAKLRAVESIQVDTAACTKIKTSFDTPDIAWRICPAMPIQP